MPDIKLKDLYGEEQAYENITELSIPKADGSGMAWYIQRPVDYFVLRESDYEPAQAGSIAYSGVGPLAGGEANLVMVNYAPLEGVSEHPVVGLASAVDGVEMGFYYVWETLTGAEILAVLNDGTDAVDGTAQPGWNLVERVDGVDTLRHIDDPESVTVPVPQPCTVWDEEAFYSLLFPAGQEEKELTLTENGTVEILPEPGSRGLRRVTVTVDAEGSSSGGAQWKSWQMVNGQCTVTAEEFETYFASHLDTAVFSLFDASPLGVSQMIEGYRMLHSNVFDGGAVMHFLTIIYNFSYETGALIQFEAKDQVVVWLTANEDGSYTMQIKYVYFNDMDVTDYIVASSTPQTIYAIPSPFAE